MTTTMNETIIVIDDDEHIRQSFSDELEDMEYRILTAKNGRAGVEVFNNEGDDLVLVDLLMTETTRDL